MTRPFPDQGLPSAIVIGSGFGGLAAAIRLAVKGYRVTVLERLDQPGGRASVFEQDGFTFDAGPTIITAPFLLEELWAICGEKMAKDIDLRRMSPFYRIRFDDGSHFDYHGEREQMRAEVARLSPDDVAGYDAFMKDADLCYQLGYVDLGTVPFETLGSLFAAVPAMVQMRAWKSIFQMAQRHFKSPKLQQVFSFHPLLIGGNPLKVTKVYSLILSLERQFGVHSAMGGTGAIVAAMVGLLERQGGAVRYGADVRQILSQAGRVTGVELQSGQKIEADLVVSNADAAWTYQKAMSSQPRRVWTDRKLAKTHYSMSLFVWYFGTKRVYDDIPHHMILLGPRYEGLLRDIFEHKRLSDDFSLYLHRPTATDPALAPPDHDAFYVLSPVPHQDSGIDWSVQAEPYRKRIEAYLEASVLPGLGANIVTSKCMTPDDFATRYLAHKGAAFGLEPILLQSAWFRPHNRSEELEGLFMVGASTHPGAGIPGVLTSAKALDTLIPTAAHWHLTGVT